MTVKSNYLIANVTCSDWLKSLLPVFQPMRSNTNHSNIMIIIFWCIRRQVYKLTLFFEAKNWGFTCLILLFSWPFKSKKSLKIYTEQNFNSQPMGFALIWGCRDGAVVRALASCLCGPRSISRSGVICGLSLLVLYSAARGFLWVLWFPLSSKTSIWLDLC